MTSATSSKYIGKKTFEIILQADLKDLIVPTVYVPTGNNIGEFKTALVSAIKTKNERNIFSEIDGVDFELKNSAGNAVLEYDDFITAASTTGKIEFTIEPSTSGSKYVGKKIFKINLQADFKYLKVPTSAVSIGDNIHQFKKNIANAVKTANIDNVFADLNYMSDFELKNSAGDADLTHTEITIAASTTGKIKVTIVAVTINPKYVLKYSGKKQLEITLS